uniref:Uncharacterized protein n=1 Tax=Oryza rufipogon TaxID=4529 RepID=A0A0E0P847_ORYRU
MCWSIGDKYIRGTPNFLSRRLKPLQNYWPISGDRGQLIKFAARPPRNEMKRASKVYHDRKGPFPPQKLAIEVRGSPTYILGHLPFHN